ncbi:MAG: hypothetical protein IJW24_01785 [Clostridia bacterium]|nr:hypothetical protein [Clostridia bacterium]
MQKSKLASLLDAIIIAGSTLVLILMLSTHITRNLIPRLGISCIFAVLVFHACIKRDRRKYQNLQLKLQEEKHLKNCILHLNFMKNTARTQFLSEIFENYKKSNNLSSVSFFYDLAADTTSSETLSQVLSLVQSNNDEACILLTHELSKSAEELFSYATPNLKTKLMIMQPPKLYALMKQQNNFPVQMNTTPNKFSMKKFLSLFSGALSRPRAKQYFLLSSIFFFSSYVLPFKTYYQIFAAIALALGSISLLFGKPKAKLTS